jgi:2-C-methyl-D-erythritol 4-phosphate cytidylyltransferase / 2-C-methyl-D-erythritol 2,4-cyclodiphosphate synthase
MQHVAILLAGGSGRRMGESTQDKILIEIGGCSVFAHGLRAFARSATQDALVVVCRDNLQRRELKGIVDRERIALPVFFTLGGAERRDSVRKGLDLLPSGVEWVTIHDCARPAVAVASLKAVRKTLLETGAPVALAHRVSDTIRRFPCDPSHAPARGALLPREQLWAMETPQAFPRDLIERAHATLDQPVTDDLAAVEAMGEPVLLVESLFPNPKLTRPADLSLLQTLLAPNAMNEAKPSPFRVGHGYDIHRLQAGLPLVLGGVQIPSEAGLVGHSDADVLSHAIADAILGACGLPDIGHYFPNTDPAIKGINSQEILARSREEAAKAGYHLVNIDATLIAEKPKVAPHIERMKQQLADTLGIGTGAIGIKATTQERIGALGQGAGIAAHAVALVAA